MKESGGKSSQSQTKSSLRPILIAAVVCAVIIAVGLAIGLGVGLGNRKQIVYRYITPTEGVPNAATPTVKTETSMITTITTVQPTTPVSGNYLWTDEFRTLDDKNWDIEVTGSPHNNELQYYTDEAENLYHEDGHIVIKPLKQDYKGRQYTSAKLTSKFAWKYGRVEVRAKLPNGDGLWPAIWMMPRNNSFYGAGWPYNGEMDILEARGSHLDEIESTIHYVDDQGKKAHFGRGVFKTNCTIDRYHTYTMDWTPDQLVYRFDNYAYHKNDISGYLSSFYSEPTAPFNMEFYLILNVAIGGDYLTDPTPSTVWNYPDAEMHVDYVRVTALEDIATVKCMVKSGAERTAVCGGVNWACYEQSFANVKSHCTDQLMDCCNPDLTAECDNDTFIELTSAVYTSYDNQINDENSCIFDGTAHKTYILHDPPPPDVTVSCEVNVEASNAQVCGAIVWACGPDNTYADVSSACGENMALTCCTASPEMCEETVLRDGADKVFASYYQEIPLATSCDFGGAAKIKYEPNLEPLKCDT